MKQIMLIIFTSILAGCAGLETLTPQQSLGAGAVAGAVTTKTVETVKEVFTPQYKMLVHGIEICDLGQNLKPMVITCYLLPCPSDKQCTKAYTPEEWLQNNEKVITVEHSLVANVSEFCKKNEDACIDFWSYYQGNKVIIVEQ